MTDARKPLIFKAFRASLTLVPAGYIAPRNAHFLGDLALGARHPPAEAVAQRDDLAFTVGQALTHEPADQRAVLAILQI